jgi:hypothetical protein
MMNDKNQSFIIHFAFLLLPSLFILSIMSILFESNFD